MPYKQLFEDAEGREVDVCYDEQTNRLVLDFVELDATEQEFNAYFDFIKSEFDRLVTQPKENKTKPTKKVVKGL